MWSLRITNLNVHERTSQNCREDTGNSKDQWGGKRRSDDLVELDCEEAFSGPHAALLRNCEGSRKVCRIEETSRVDAYISKLTC
jgi:hypothetical protein